MVALPRVQYSNSCQLLGMSSRYDPIYIYHARSQKLVCGRSCPVCSNVACASFSYTGLGLAPVACLPGQLRRSYWSFTSRIVTKPDQSVGGSASGGGTTIPALLRMSKKLGGRPSAHLIFPPKLFPCFLFESKLLTGWVSRRSADPTCVRRLIA